LRHKSIPHPSYPFENATHWHMRAEKMRTLAEEGIDSTVRAMMLRIAADYDRLAESRMSAAHDSIMFQTRGSAEVMPESLSETRRSRAENSGPRSSSPRRRSINGDSGEVSA
jgi:hypothetical protein